MPMIRAPLMRLSYILSSAKSRRPRKRRGPNRERRTASMPKIVRLPVKAAVIEDLERANAYIAEWRRTHTATAIARRHGVSAGYVRKLRQEAGLTNKTGQQKSNR